MWQDEMVPMVRVMIGDISDTPQYTDTRLETAICISAKYVNAQFFKTYTITNSSIAPDPVSAEDEWFVNLTALKAACMIGNAEMRVAAGQGISIKDGPSALDLTGISQYKVTSAKTFCQQYEDAVTGYTMGGGNNGLGYSAVIGPFDWNTYARYYRSQRYSRDY